MTTATARSARSGIGRSVPLENGEDRLELGAQVLDRLRRERATCLRLELPAAPILLDLLARPLDGVFLDRKSTRLNSSHSQISYAVFCLKKKKKPQLDTNVYTSRIA